MKNQPAAAPTTLTPEQEAMVAGGALNAYNIVRAGCPTCTSGLPVAFMNIAAVVNPAPMAQTLG
jgi:hypothetical protein